MNTIGVPCCDIMPPRAIMDILKDLQVKKVKLPISVEGWLKAQSEHDECRRHYLFKTLAEYNQVRDLNMSAVEIGDMVHKLILQITEGT